MRKEPEATLLTTTEDLKCKDPSEIADPISSHMCETIAGICRKGKTWCNALVDGLNSKDSISV